MSSQTQQLLNLASRAVAANQQLLTTINSMQAMIDEYNAVTPVTQFSDGLFSNTGLAYLSAYNIESLISTIFPRFQQIYQDTANYTANSGFNKSIMNQCQP